jgi:hypothetical protein
MDHLSPYIHIYMHIYTYTSLLPHDQVRRSLAAIIHGSHLSLIHINTHTNIHTYTYTADMHIATTTIVKICIRRRQYMGNMCPETRVCM